MKASDVIFGAILAGLVAGCSARDTARLESPVMVGVVAVGSYEACCATAQSRPDEAAITLRVLNGLVPQFHACQAGLLACLPAADPNAVE